MPDFAHFANLICFSLPFQIHFLPNWNWVIRSYFSSYLSLWDCHGSHGFLLFCFKISNSGLFLFFIRPLPEKLIVITLFNKSCRWLDSNPCPQESEATALSTPAQFYSSVFIDFTKCAILRHFSIYFRLLKTKCKKWST